MQELEFSVMASSAVGLQPLLDEFSAKYDIPIRLRILTWDSAWNELVKVALYGDGPDISELGSTWLGDLIAMNTLAAFEARELAQLGAPAAFLPSAMRNCHLANQADVVWAIPWLTGARLVFFRRNLLERAGIDEHEAFLSSDHFAWTLSRLQASGVAIPWTVPTGATHTTLLNVASWVWGAGGEFLSADGKKALFSQPAAVAGLQAYFALGRYIPPAVRHLTALEPDQQFLRDRNTAMTISGAWLFKSFKEQAADPFSQLGVALPPGPSFVGGSQLVIWKHCHQRGAALKLIHFLTQTPTQVTHSQQVGLSPATLEALAAPPFATDPLWQLAVHGLEAGRSFPVTRFGGLMEDRLTVELSNIWAEILSSPEADLPAMITQQLKPLAQRLDRVAGHNL